VLKDWDLFSSVASSSAGVELMHNVVIVMGNDALSASPFVIGHSCRIPSTSPLWSKPSPASGLIRRAGSIRRSRVGWSTYSPRPRLRLTAACAAFAIRCSRIQTSAPPATRAAVGGLIGGLSGTGAVYVSGGAEHQGPPGGGPVAVIAHV
jgi:cyanuric acid amidohydrolase